MSSFLTCSLEFFSELSGIQFLLLPISIEKSDFIYFECFVFPVFIYSTHIYFLGGGVGERASMFDKKILSLKETQL